MDSAVFTVERYIQYSVCGPLFGNHRGICSLVFVTARAGHLLSDHFISLV